MFSIRKLVCRPRLDDWAPLAKFFYADEALQTVANELDSFDGSRDQERCQELVHQLRQCQDRVLQHIEEMLCEVFPNETDRAPRDFRVKFPDDILHENLPGQLWFGAECLAAGSNIIERELESEALRPLAKVFIQNLNMLREALKQQSLKNVYVYPERVRNLLRQFDVVFAEFELNYVSAMVPVKSVKEYEMQLDVAVLFSETLIRAVQSGYITKCMIDDCDPSIMITLPRLAIICGLLMNSEGPLSVDKPSEQLPDMFRPFRTLLHKIRELLRTLTSDELTTLERALSSQEGASTFVDESDVTLVSEYRRRSNSRGAKKAFVPPVLDASSIASPDSITAAKRQQQQENETTLNANQTSCDKVQEGECDSKKVVQTQVTSDSDRQRSSCSTSSSSSSSSLSSSAEQEASVQITIDSQLWREDNSAPDVEITYRHLASSNGADMKNEERPDQARMSQNESLRSRFRSTQDLIHRLFVCVAGVADQMQSNYPSDLRTVLKMVLHPEDVVNVFEVSGKPARGQAPEEEVGVEANEQASVNSANTAESQSQPVFWVPDSECASCSACQATFTLVRRRHHCRNCGQIFCGRCSRNSAPLPKHGYTKAVRVCNQCFFYKLAPFTTAASGAP